MLRRLLTVTVVAVVFLITTSPAHTGAVGYTRATEFRVGPVKQGHCAPAPTTAGGIGGNRARTTRERCPSGPRRRYGGIRATRFYANGSRWVTRCRYGAA